MLSRAIIIFILRLLPIHYEYYYFSEADMNGDDNNSDDERSVMSKSPIEEDNNDDNTMDSNKEGALNLVSECKFNKPLPFPSLPPAFIRNVKKSANTRVNNK